MTSYLNNLLKYHCDSGLISRSPYGVVGLNLLQADFEPFYHVIYHDYYVSPYNLVRNNVRQITSAKLPPFYGIKGSKHPDIDEESIKNMNVIGGINNNLEIWVDSFTEKLYLAIYNFLIVDFYCLGSIDQWIKNTLPIEDSITYKKLRPDLFAVYSSFRYFDEEGEIKLGKFDKYFLPEISDKYCFNHNDTMKRVKFCDDYNFRWCDSGEIIDIEKLSIVDFLDSLVNVEKDLLECVPILYGFAPILFLQKKFTSKDLTQDDLVAFIKNTLFLDPIKYCYGLLDINHLFANYEPSIDKKLYFSIEYIHGLTLNKNNSFFDKWLSENLKKFKNRPEQLNFFGVSRSILLHGFRSGFDLSENFRKNLIMDHITIDDVQIYRQNTNSDVYGLMPFYEAIKNMKDFITTEAIENNPLFKLQTKNFEGVDPMHCSIAKEDPKFIQSYSEKYFGFNKILEYIYKYKDIVKVPFKVFFECKSMFKKQTSSAKFVYLNILDNVDDISPLKSFSIEEVEYLISTKYIPIPKCILNNTRLRHNFKENLEILLIQNCDIIQFLNFEKCVDKLLLFFDEKELEAFGIIINQKSRKFAELTDTDPFVFFNCTCDDFINRDYMLYFLIDHLITFNTSYHVIDDPYDSALCAHAYKTYFMDAFYYNIKALDALFFARLVYLASNKFYFEETTQDSEYDSTVSDLDTICYITDYNFIKHIIFDLPRPSCEYRFDRRYKNNDLYSKELPMAMCVQEERNLLAPIFPQKKETQTEELNDEEDSDTEEDYGMLDLGKVDISGLNQALAEYFSSNQKK